MEALDHKCLSCGAKLPFNPETQKWDCQYCGKSFSLKELEEYEQKYVRSWRIPEKFKALYSKCMLTYDEWVKLFIMWIPGEIQI